MLPTDRPRGRFRQLLIYFGLAENPDAPRPERGSSPRPFTNEQGAGGRAHAALAYFGLVEGPADSRYGHTVKPELDDDVDALRARVAELEARLAALEERR